MLTAAIAAASNGDNTVVAADAGGRCIRVVAFALSFGGTVNAKWRSNTTDKTGLFYGLAGVFAQSPDVPPSMRGPGAQFATAGGETLVLNLSGAVAVGGYVVYELVPVGMA